MVPLDFSFYNYLNLYKYIIICVAAHFFLFQRNDISELNIVKVIYLGRTLTLLWRIGLNTELSNLKKIIFYEKIGTAVCNKKNVFFSIILNTKSN